MYYFDRTTGTIRQKNEQSTTTTTTIENTNNILSVSHPSSTSDSVGNFNFLKKEDSKFNHDSNNITQRSQDIHPYVYKSQPNSLNPKHSSHPNTILSPKGSNITDNNSVLYYDRVTKTIQRKNFNSTSENFHNNIPQSQFQTQPQIKSSEKLRNAENHTKSHSHTQNYLINSNQTNERNLSHTQRKIQRNESYEEEGLQQRQQQNHYQNQHLSEQIKIHETFNNQTIETQNDQQKSTQIEKLTPQDDHPQQQPFQLIDTSLRSQIITHNSNTQQQLQEFKESDLQRKIEILQNRFLHFFYLNASLISHFQNLSNQFNREYYKQWRENQILQEKIINKESEIKIYSYLSQFFDLSLKTEEELNILCQLLLVTESDIEKIWSEFVKYSQQFEFDSNVRFESLSSLSDSLYQTLSILSSPSLSIPNSFDQSNGDGFEDYKDSEDDEEIKREMKEIENLKREIVKELEDVSEKMKIFGERVIEEKKCLEENNSLLELYHSLSERYLSISLSESNL